MGVSICIEYEDFLLHKAQWNTAFLNFPAETVYVHGAGNKDPLIGRLVEDAVYVASVKDLPDTLVLLAPERGDEVRGEEPLSTFRHPENVVYYFGNNSESVLPEHFADRAPDHAVYIDLASHRDMWSWMAWAIVVYDRRTKAL